MVYPTRHLGNYWTSKKMLLKPNELCATTYEAKEVVYPLELEIQKMHAYPNDCILYRGRDYENLDE